jgi:hypothetical protein
LLSSLRHRAYQDFFMGSRLADYRRLLDSLKERGYAFRTMAEFVQASSRGEKAVSPTCLLRNDIDSDPDGAARMFACDRAAGVRATYFFRLATIDPPLMRDIARHGGEVGYHFEEIASAAKRLGLRSREQIEAKLDSIRHEFRENISAFRDRSGVAPRMVASHGDFANRRIGIPNHHLLTRDLMDETGIVADAYDPRIHAQLDARYSDWPAPHWWRPHSPVSERPERARTISILVHPRQWVCHPGLNLRPTHESRSPLFHRGRGQGVDAHRREASPSRRTIPLGA